MRRLSSPGHARQSTPWLWLVAVFLLICVALNGFSMFAELESDGDVAGQPALPALATRPAP